MDLEAFELIESLSIFCPSSIMLCVIPDNKDKSLIKSIYQYLIFGINYY